MSVNDNKNRRQIKPTLQKLESDENDAIEALELLISASSNLETMSPEDLKQFSTQLVEARASFRNANKDLVSFHMDKHQMHEATTIRKRRYQLLHSESSELMELIPLLNHWLQERGCEAISDIESTVSHPSQITSPLKKLSVNGDAAKDGGAPASQLNDGDLTGAALNNVINPIVQQPTGSPNTTYQFQSAHSALNPANRVRFGPHSVIRANSLPLGVSAAGLGANVSRAPTHTLTPGTGANQQTPTPHHSLAPNPNPNSGQGAGFIGYLPASTQITASDRYRLKSDLMNGVGEPFTGQPEYYQQWMTLLSRRMQEAGVDSLSSIEIIIANTKGEVKESVKKYLSAGIADADTTLQTIWTMLADRYGEEEEIAASIKRSLWEMKKVNSIKDVKNLRCMVDTLLIASSHALSNKNLSILNFTEGINPIIDKLPEKIIHMWNDHKYKYKTNTGNLPDFELLVSFLSEKLKRYSFEFGANSSDENSRGRGKVVKNFATNVENSHGKGVENSSKPSNSQGCIYDGKGDHCIDNCPAFEELSYDIRKSFAKDNKLCYICLFTHRATNCRRKKFIKCKRCSGAHATGMHRDSVHYQNDSERAGASINPHVGNLGSKDHISPKYHRYRDGHGSGGAVSDNEDRHRPDRSRTSTSGSTTLREGEFKKKYEEGGTYGPVSNQVKTACTTVCLQGKPRVCLKTLVVDIKHPNKVETLRGLCMIDTQSNCSFVEPSVIEFFKPELTCEDYCLTTMGGKFNIKGHSAGGFEVKSAGGGKYFSLPPLLTHPCMPGANGEVATSSTVRAHPHIAHYASLFPDNVDDLDVILLIGADCGELMQNTTHGCKPPYVSQTPLGFTIVGPVCLDEGEVSSNFEIKVLRTSAEMLCDEPNNAFRRFVPSYSRIPLSSPFEVRNDDDMKGISQDNILFNDIVSNSICVNEKGNIEMALAIKPNAEIPDNRAAIYNRSFNTLMRLKRDKKKLTSSCQVMGEYIRAGHVEQLALVHPSEPNGHRRNYIPIFPVYNEAKQKTRLVFDSSAVVKGKSLNQALLPGPDEGNSLFGVLQRFRIGEIGFSGDVEKCFHSFFVRECDRSLMKFFWFRDNNPDNELCEYQANVMIFGNRNSPACANFGLKYATLGPNAERYPLSCEFIRNNMYVDDLLGSSDSVNEAKDILNGCVEVLSTYNIRLHKFSSSSKEVLESFPESEKASTEVSIVPGEDDTRALGVAWSPSSDTLSLTSLVPNRPFTKRGMLAVVHCIFDPIGVGSPIVLIAKLMMREIFPPKNKVTPDIQDYAWDDPLPDHLYKKWSTWLESLSSIHKVSIPRCHKPKGFGKVVKYELHCFSDANKDSIGFVIFLRAFNTGGDISVSFIQGSSKVSPRTADTIPRLELTSAMNGVHSTLSVAKELGLNFSSIHFYTDSLIVLGYLNNRSKCFCRYVARRVEEILKFTTVEDWHHISGKENVGDIATRPHTPDQLLSTDWLIGPKFLRENLPIPSVDVSNLELPDTKVMSLQTHVVRSDIFPNIIDSFCARSNSWKKTMNLLIIWIRFTRKLAKREPLSRKDEIERAKLLLLKRAQQLQFDKQINLLKNGKELPSKDCLLSLNPFLDEDEVLRVGGRLKNAGFPHDVAHPILLPSQHAVTKMIIDYHHNAIKHQGRLLTHGAIRQAGFHIFHGSKSIKQFIHGCLFCRRLRGKLESPIMADLPADRVSDKVAIFDVVGIDCFGPMYVHDGRSTRRTNASKKVYGLLITCLASRAIHIEMLPSMDTTSFELGIRRFMAVRGRCSKIYSDVGSNFVGAINTDLDINSVKELSSNLNISWVLSPPYAKNFNGVWERKIQAVKHVLNASMQLLGKHTLSREELSTLLQEACSIVNNTPLWEVSNNPDDPCPVSPANIITLKEEPNPPSIDQFTESDIYQYGKRRWRRVQYLSEQFWIRWKRHYLLDLQTRQRWKKRTRNILVGDIVLLSTESKRNKWPLARVEVAKPGEDGVVRRVTVRTCPKGGRPHYYDRSTRDIVWLETPAP